MIIRKTRVEELGAVMQIYDRAARYMAETGNPNQWAIGYPTREMIMEDIARGVSHVVDVNGVIEAVFAYIEGVDPTYGRIENGAWRSNGRYGTIHRIASAGRMKGMASKCFAWCENEAREHGLSGLRVDTHNDNRIMQRVVVQSGFAYCGIIYLANGAPRLAYEKVLFQENAQSAPVQNNTVPNYNVPNYNMQNNAQMYRTYDVRQQQKGDGVMLGIFSMILGIVSILLFCTCVNYVTAIAAIILGIVQIAKNKEKSFAVVGIVTSVISMILAFVLFFVIGVGVIESEGDSYDEYYEEYYDDEYYDEEYLEDYFYDGYFEEEGGAEFL